MKAFLVALVLVASPAAAETNATEEVPEEAGAERTGSGGVLPVLLLVFGVLGLAALAWAGGRRKGR